LFGHEVLRGSEKRIGRPTQAFEFGMAQVIDRVDEPEALRRAG